MFRVVAILQPNICRSQPCSCPSWEGFLPKLRGKVFLSDVEVRFVAGKCWFVSLTGRNASLTERNQMSQRANHLVRANEELPELSEVLMIAVVDDDESMREAMKNLVTSLGYSAATFASAEEFLQSKWIDDTACVISDVQMPGLSGVELQSHLIAQGNRTPMIFVSAFSDERTCARALKAGAIGFLSKPFNEERLIEYLHAALADLEPVAA
jgi:CheY-like chemotaxis protein